MDIVKRIKDKEQALQHMAAVADFRLQNVGKKRFLPERRGIWFQRPASGQHGGGIFYAKGSKKTDIELLCFTVYRG